MPSLLFAAAIWVGIHIGIGGAARRAWLTSRVGDRAFRLSFSLASVFALIYLIHAKVEAEGDYLWTAPPSVRLALEVAMLPAIWLFLASIAGPNPTLLGSSKAVPTTIRGVQRITRHPMLWAFAIWALVHISVKGDTAALVFFGAFALTALLGMPSIDAKLAAANPDAWATLRASTSIVPFAAIVSRRNRLALDEISWVGLGLAAVLWIAAVWLHQEILGYSILPAF